MELDVVLGAFHKEDVIEGDANVSVVALHDEKLIALDGIVVVILHVAIEYLLAGSHKVFVGDRLEQIVEGVHLICLDGILLEGGGEDDLHVLWHHLGKFQSANLLHVDG